MANKIPIVNYNGKLKELQTGDTISGSGGSTTITGQVTIDFGPIGQEDGSTITTVLTALVTTASIINIFPSGVATIDHDPDDYQVDNISAYATNIVNGVSFDVIGNAPNGSYGQYLMNYIIN